MRRIRRTFINHPNNTQSLRLQTSHSNTNNTYETNHDNHNLDCTTNANLIVHHINNNDHDHDDNDDIDDNDHNRNNNDDNSNNTMNLNNYNHNIITLDDSDNLITYNNDNLIINNSIHNLFHHIENENKLDEQLQLRQNQYGRILKAIREVISCCACYTSDTLMKECMNGHLICQNCFLTLRQDERPQCPTCRANLYSDSRRALIAQKVLSELPDLCIECKTHMLHKSLANHRLNLCPKRFVMCNLSPLGCDWIGYADQYPIHYHNCLVYKNLLEKPLNENLDFLLNRFKINEQSIREIFHCFSTVLRHLETHELQTAYITLSSMNITDREISYRSDHFHVNQSRWTVEINIKLNNSPHHPDDNATSTDQTINLSTNNSILNENLITLNENSGDLFSNVTTTTTTSSSSSCSSDTVQTDSNPTVIRHRRLHANATNRHHPYQQNSYNYHTNYYMHTHHNDNNSTTRNNDQTTDERTRTHTSVTSTPSNVTTITNSDPNWNGEINYRFIKENSPGIGRKSFSFSFLQLKVPDTGIHIFARPQLHTHRFNIRGEQTTFYKIHPIRWRFINNLNDMNKYRLIQAEFIIARRINEEHAES